MEAKAWYWFSHPNDGYIPAQVKSVKPDGEYIIRTSTNEQFSVGEVLQRAHESSLEIHENMVAMQVRFIFELLSRASSSLCTCFVIVKKTFTPFTDPCTSTLSHFLPYRDTPGTVRASYLT